MAKIDSTDTTITTETLESVKQKLSDICGYMAAVKHIINLEEATNMQTAVMVIVNRAGAVADSIIIKDLKTPGCIGDENEWFSHNE